MIEASANIVDGNVRVCVFVCPSPCKGTGLQECSDPKTCGDGDNRYNGVCDKDGCDFNSYRMGVKDFYGKGKTVDTSKKFTVVTQFIGTGDAMEIKRFYEHLLNIPDVSFCSFRM